MSDIEHTIAYKRRDMEMKWDRIRNHLETAINILKPRKKVAYNREKARNGIYRIQSEVL